MAERAEPASESVQGELIRSAREIFRNGFLAQFGDFFTQEEIGLIEGWFINQTLHKYNLRYNWAVPNLIRRGVTSLRFGAHIWILEKLVERVEPGSERAVNKQQNKAKRGVENIMRNAEGAEKAIAAYPQKMKQVEEWNASVEKFFRDLQPGFDRVTDLVISKPVEGALILITKAGEILGGVTALILKKGVEIIVENIRALFKH